MLGRNKRSTKAKRRVVVFPTTQLGRSCRAQRAVVQAALPVHNMSHVRDTMCKSESRTGECRTIFSTEVKDVPLFGQPLKTILRIVWTTPGPLLFRPLGAVEPTSEQLGVSVLPACYASVASWPRTHPASWPLFRSPPFCSQLQTSVRSLLVVRPGAPSSFLFLVAMPGPPSSVLAPSASLGVSKASKSCALRAQWEDFLQALSFEQQRLLEVSQDASLVSW